ncbi:ankyrin repeat-containing protein BDA1-like [Corylus avellana]|uniref:ankyrin repeat-containing protein BDA1-like n=1 Tax=Corylus avellana TaxID=13451 RepID=UPI00286BD69F|nr:ankyrin repeat-containing protein BDA1-like [Corylus avellana]
MEIVRLNHSFARRLNQDGFTPMHLTLQNKQTQLALLLLDVDEDLVRVQRREGVTPLHYVVEIGNVHLLAEFLKACPKSIEYVTVQRETVLHIALKYNMFDAFWLLLGWLQRGPSLEMPHCGRRSCSIGKMRKATLYCTLRYSKINPRSFFHCKVDISAKNSGGFTAFDMLHNSNSIAPTIDNSEYSTP